MEMDRYIEIDIRFPWINPCEAITITSSWDLLSNSSGVAWKIVGWLSCSGNPSQCVTRSNMRRPSDISYRTKKTLAPDWTKIFFKRWVSWITGFPSWKTVFLGDRRNQATSPIASPGDWWRGWSLGKLHWRRPVPAVVARSFQGLRNGESLLTICHIFRRKYVGNWFSAWDSGVSYVQTNPYDKS